LWPPPHAKRGLELGADVGPHARLVGLPELQQVEIDRVGVTMLIVGDSRVGVPAAHDASPEGDGAALGSAALRVGEHRGAVHGPHDHVHGPPGPVGIQLRRLPLPAHFEAVHVLQARRRQPHRSNLLELQCCELTPS
jgi:hypothetical protein